MTSDTQLNPLGPTRSQVLALLQRTPDHLTVPDIADVLGLHRNSARFHLDALVEAGYAERAPGPPAGQGRPPMLYSATRQAPTVSNTHLLELTSILLQHFVAKSPDGITVGQAAGRDWGASSITDGAGSDILDGLTAHLAERGFGTLREDDQLCFTRCPFRESIAAQLPFVCAIHQGFIDGYLEASSGDLTAGKLRVGETVCTVTIA